MKRQRDSFSEENYWINEHYFDLDAIKNQLTVIDYLNLSITNKKTFKILRTDTTPLIKLMIRLYKFFTKNEIEFKKIDDDLTKNFKSIYNDIRLKMANITTSIAYTKKHF